MSKGRIRPWNGPTGRACLAALQVIPGVVRVGFGLADPDADRPVLAWRVYVGEGHIWGQSGSVEDLCGSGQGFPGTLVMDAGPGIPCSSTPNLFPGDEISRHISNTQRARGTLGFIVRKGAQRYILTCEHVLNVGSMLQNDELDIYQPSKGTCNNPVAKAAFGAAHMVKHPVKFENRLFDVDVALAPLLPGVKSANKRSTLPNIKQALRDVLAELPAGDLATPAIVDTEPGLLAAVAAAKQINLKAAQKQIRVRKHGATTGYTEGRIVGICFVDVAKRVINELPADDPLNQELAQPKFVFQLMIAPDPAKAHDYNETYTVPNAVFEEIKAFYADDFLIHTVTMTVVKAEAETTTFSVKGKVFSLKGDSGSGIFDPDGRIVGVLDAGNLLQVTPVGEKNDVFLPNGIGIAQFVRPAYHALGLAPDAAVPGGNPVAGSLLDERPPAAPSLDEAFDTLAATVGRSPDGRRLLALGRAHHAELRELVHHRRRVTVTWHRHKGPAFLAALLRAMQEPGRLLPREVEGVSLRTCLGEMRAVLSGEDSPGLAADLAAQGDWIIDLFERATSLEEAVRLLSAIPEEPDQERLAPAFLQVVNAEGVPGTAGALVRLPDGALGLLSAQHVLCGGGAPPGGPVWAREEHGGRTRFTTVGRVAASLIGRVTYRGEPVFVDAAVARLSDPEDLPASIRASLRGMAAGDGIAQPFPGQQVTKLGAATRRTEGVVVDVAYPDLPFVEGRRHEAPGQLLIRPTGAAGIPAGEAVNFCMTGDSGAALRDRQGRLVGLLWGSNASGEGVACPIAPVLDVLGLVPARGDPLPLAPMV